MSFESYKNIDYGTKPTTTKIEDVILDIQPEMVLSYARAYIREALRVNPLKTEKLELTEEELNNYFLGLLRIRIESLDPNGCKVWRTAKQLVIPDFYQFVLSTIGIVTDHTYGLRFVPTFSYDYDIQTMLDTSTKVESLIRDGLTASKDAMPRGIDGDPDVMGFIISDGYVMARTDTQAPIMSYVAAFLGIKLREEIKYKMLYRVRYDDVPFIEQALMHERSIICSKDT